MEALRSLISDDLSGYLHKSCMLSLCISGDNVGTTVGCDPGCVVTVIAWI